MVSAQKKVMAQGIKYKIFKRGEILDYPGKASMKGDLRKVSELVKIPKGRG